MTDGQRALIYGVNSRQIRRWRARGLNVDSPQELLAALAKQNRPGSVFERLRRADVLMTSVEAMRKGMDKVPFPLTRQGRAPQS